MEQAAEGKSKNPLILYIVLPLITFAIAFFAFSYFTKTFVFAVEQRSTSTKYTYSMEEIIVNLKDGKHYLKTTIALGYGLSDDLKMIQEKEVQIRDTIICILRSKSTEDIMPIESTEGLKSEIQDKLNQFFDEKIITGIYITDFIIQ